MPVTKKIPYNPASLTPFKASNTDILKRRMYMTVARKTQELATTPIQGSDAGTGYSKVRPYITIGLGTTMIVCGTIASTIKAQQLSKDMKDFSSTAESVLNAGKAPGTTLTAKDKYTFEKVIDVNEKSTIEKFLADKDGFMRMKGDASSALKNVRTIEEKMSSDFGYVNKRGKSVRYKGATKNLTPLQVHQIKQIINTGPGATGYVRGYSNHGRLITYEEAVLIKQAKENKSYAKGKQKLKLHKRKMLHAVKSIVMQNMNQNEMVNGYQYATKITRPVNIMGRFLYNKMLRTTLTKIVQKGFVEQGMGIILQAPGAVTKKIGEKLEVQAVKAAAKGRTAVINRARAVKIKNIGDSLKKPGQSVVKYGKKGGISATKQKVKRSLLKPFSYPRILIHKIMKQAGEAVGRTLIGKIIGSIGSVLLKILSPIKMILKYIIGAFAGLIIISILVIVVLSAINSLISTVTGWFTISEDEATSIEQIIENEKFDVTWMVEELDELHDSFIAITNTVISNRQKEDEEQIIAPYAADGFTTATRSININLNGVKDNYRECISYLAAVTQNSYNQNMPMSDLQEWLRTMYMGSHAIDIQITNIIAIYDPIFLTDPETGELILYDGFPQQIGQTPDSVYYTLDIKVTTLYGEDAIIKNTQMASMEQAFNQACTYLGDTTSRWNIKEFAGWVSGFYNTEEVWDLPAKENTYVGYKENMFYKTDFDTP